MKKNYLELEAELMHIYPIKDKGYNVTGALALLAYTPSGLRFDINVECSPALIKEVEAKAQIHDNIVFSGHIENRVWETSGGNNRSATIVVAESLIEVKKDRRNVSDDSFPT